MSDKNATPLVGVVPALLHYQMHERIEVVQKRGYHPGKRGGVSY